MTRPEIQLPITYSTVKQWYSDSQFIAMGAFVLTCIIGSIYCILSLLHSDGHGGFTSGDWGLVWISVPFLAILILTIGSGIAFFKDKMIAIVWDHIPKLTCIKDEEDT